MEKLDSMIGWIYREIDLSGITSPLWRLPVRPSESYDWILHRIQMQYDSDGEDPSSFDTILWRFSISGQNRALQDISDWKPRTPISLTCLGGVNDLTAGTTRPKQLYYASPPIEWPIQALEVFALELESFTALTGSVDVLFIGSFVLPKDTIVNAEMGACK